MWNQARIRRFRRRILDWYEREKRTLPWRSDADPYRVWVSEIMLQQTQVRTVLPYYERFLERFPDLQTLAAAPESEVLSLWSGLGYYSRPRNMRRAAQKIVNEFGGKFPDTTEALLQLPGVGRYTAGAIRSIVFNSPEPVVDGNVKRVICRLHGIRRRVSENYFWKEAAILVSRTRPADFNQAIMELGALVCTYRRPACGDCPVRGFCEARLRGIQEQIPAGKNARATSSVELVLLVVRRAGEVLVTSKSAASFVPGRYALPGCVLERGRSPEAAARELLHEISASPFEIHARASIRHTITFRRLTAHVFHADAGGARIRAATCRQFSWIACSNFDRFVTSALYSKALNSADS